MLETSGTRAIPYTLDRYGYKDYWHRSRGDGDSGITYLRRRVNAAEAALRAGALIATSPYRERVALAESEATVMRLSWEL